MIETYPGAFGTSSSEEHGVNAMFRLNMIVEGFALGWKKSEDYIR